MNTSIERPQRRQLTAEHEKELVARFQAGDSKAGDQLVQACLPFVMTIALEYRRWGVPTEDIVQEGSIGLLKAIARFDPNRGCRLVTYAAYWIRAEIRDHVIRAYRVVRIGASKAERRAIRHYRNTRERDPEALAKVSGLTVEKVRRLLPLLVARDASLDDRDSDGRCESDRIASGQPSPEQSVAKSESAQQMTGALEKALVELCPRDRSIVEQRYLSDEPQTLEQVGSQFGISKERVRQLEERAKKAMRARIVELTSEPPRHAA
jgi:RNA polymerase sigma-32 factor